MCLMSMRDRDVSWARFAIMVSSVPLTPFVVSKSGTLVIGLISIETGVVWMNIDCVCVCVCACMYVCGRECSCAYVKKLI